MVTRGIKTPFRSWYSHKIQVYFKTPSNQHSFLNGTSTQYIEDMYNAWLKDPSSVHVSWDSYFRTSVYNPPPSLVPLGTTNAPPSAAPTKSTKHESDTEPTGQEYQIVQNIITSYQVRGHLVANLDPLEIVKPNKNSILGDFKLDDKALNKVYAIPKFSTYIAGNEDKLSLKEIIKRLEAVYCNHIGAEFMYIPDSKVCDWIRQRLETPGVTEISPQEKKFILDRLVVTTGFEGFLERKFPSEKRFGLEGCEVLIPCMDAIINKSSEMGTESFIIGMPHRGRLNVLANICDTSLLKIFTQFQPIKTTGEGYGDVKYHLGTYSEGVNKLTNKHMRVTLVANPSHLEIVTPVVQGRAKAEQFFKGDAKVLPILLHGDAAFSGQGIVYESINLSGLPAYTNRGVVHIVVNNQIGFTTDPRCSRSSPHCTDVARVINVPIFHVNSDDPDSVFYVSKLAAELRSTFLTDVVIDLVSYRRNGHNEGDEPRFTQPLMYAKIKKTPSILTKYSQKMIAESLATEDEIKNATAAYDKKCVEGLEQAQQETEINLNAWVENPSFFSNTQCDEIKPTGIPEDVINRIGTVFSSPPPKDFEMHKGLERVLKNRREMIENRQIDIALSEVMAFGSLLKDGIHVRLAGQDSERGTFSHRHHVLHDQKVDNSTYNPIANVYPDQAIYTVCNSPLSEYGTLSFETGYSLYNPNTLVLWESQFGDFANNAQAIFDTIIASGETKWIRQSGLVMLLPHGMEGQGAEHSSARLERMLQLAAEDPDTFPPDDEHFVINQLRAINWIVANCSTPANLFHILRRQTAMPFRKPLMLMTAKSLLRHPECRSSFDDILEGTELSRVIPEKGPASQNGSDVKKLIFCSGKVYYDLKKYLREKNVESEIAVARIEQLCPFPFDLVQEECAKYPEAKLAWCQEEHKNQGAWAFVKPRIGTAISRQRRIEYVGRPVSASTAPGLKVKYEEELKEFLQQAACIDSDDH